MRFIDGRVSSSSSWCDAHRPSGRYVRRRPGIRQSVAKRKISRRSYITIFLFFCAEIKINHMAAACARRHSRGRGRRSSAPCHRGWPARPWRGRVKRCRPAEEKARHIYAVSNHIGALHRAACRQPPPRPIVIVSDASLRRTSSKLAARAACIIETAGTIMCAEKYLTEKPRAIYLL